MTTAELGRGGRPAWQRAEHAVADQADVARAGRAARDPDVDHVDLPGMALARVDPQARLGRVKCDGLGGFDRRAGDDSAIRIDSTGHVHAHDKPRRSLDNRDRLGHRSMGDAREARAKQRIDDHMRVRNRLVGDAIRERQRRRPGQTLEVGARIGRELLAGHQAHDRHVPARLAQQPRDDETVAAIVAFAAHHDHRPVGRELFHGPMPRPARRAPSDLARVSPAARSPSGRPPASAGRRAAARTSREAPP